MFDGVKIRCENVHRGYWENHPALDFTLPVSAKTGEVLPESIRAKYKELTFKITPSRKTPGHYWHFIEGSLHRFANDGGVNINDFGFGSVVNTINQICKEFDVKAETAPLENIEFGVNIPLTIPAKEFLKNLVCHGGRAFAEMNRDKKDVGKVVQRQQYALKIYDKGKQSQNGDTNILRIEIHVHRMEFVKEYGMINLADIKEKTKVEKLGLLLKSVISQAVYYDGSIKEQELTEAERSRLKDFQNPKWWGDLDKRRRYYYKSVYAKMMEKHGANNEFLSVVNQIEKKWFELLEQGAEDLDFLTGLKNEQGAEDLDFLTVRMKGYKVQLETNNIHTYKRVNFYFLPDFEENQRPPKKASQSVKMSACFCASCGRDITRQKTGSIYCSEKHFGKQARKCRDKGSRRKRPPLSTIEAARLEVLKKMDLAGLLLVTVIKSTRDEAKKRIFKPVCIWPPETGNIQDLARFKNEAAKVRVTTCDGRQMVFTWKRAKEAIELITKVI